MTDNKKSATEIDDLVDRIIDTIHKHWGSDPSVDNIMNLLVFLSSRMIAFTGAERALICEQFCQQVRKNVKTVGDELEKN